MSNRALNLTPRVYGEHFAGVWLLDQKWADENDGRSVAIIFYACAFYKKLDLHRYKDGGYETEVTGFTYVTEGNRVMSFSMDEPLPDPGVPLTDEEMDAAASEWKYDGKDLWMFEGDWLQFHPSTISELISVGFDRETVEYWRLVIELSDPNFREAVDSLPLPGNAE